MIFDYKNQPQEPGDFTVCYSGGLDSTAVAYMMAFKYTGKVHLWTLDHNYGSLFAGWSRKHAEDLARILGRERVTHTINNVSDVFQRLTLSTFWHDLKEYRSHFIWCLGCQLSMVAKVIVYNLIHSVPRVFLCSSTGGEYAVMSMPISVATKQKLYWEYGIHLRTPLLEWGMTKEDERKVLKEAGIWSGVRLRRGTHFVQPYCIPGLQHIGDVFFDFHTTYPPEQVERYILDKAILIREYVRERIAEEGLDLEELIVRNREQHQEVPRIYPDRE
jgi:hypothetical protein